MKGSDLTGAPQCPLIDISQLESFIELGPLAYDEILNDAIHQIPIYLAQIKAAIMDGNAQQLKACAHRIRGTLLTFGCVAMGAHCSRLEFHTSVTSDQAATIHSELLSLWNQSLAAIRVWEKSVPEFAR